MLVQTSFERSMGDGDGRLIRVHVFSCVGLGVYTRRVWVVIVRKVIML